MIIIRCRGHPLKIIYTSKRFHVPPRDTCRKDWLIIRRKVKPQFVVACVITGLIICIILVLINLALNSPSSDKNLTIETVNTSVAHTTNKSETTEETTVEPTIENDEDTTKKQKEESEDKNDDSKKSENLKKDDKKDNSSETSKNNTSSKSLNINSSSSNSSSNNGSGSSNTEKTTKPIKKPVTQTTTKPTTKPTQKPTTKPTTPTKPTQIPNNVYLSIRSSYVNKGDVVFLSLINAENGVSWSISNSSILQNYGGGGNQCSFKALNKGSATVTASYEGKNYCCTVNVT